LDLFVLNVLYDIVALLGRMCDFVAVLYVMFELVIRAFPCTADSAVNAQRRALSAFVPFMVVNLAAQIHLFAVGAIDWQL
jgi:hypothetical protein